jgi:hypothetical protein
MNNDDSHKHITSTNTHFNLQVAYRRAETCRFSSSINGWVKRSVACMKVLLPRSHGGTEETHKFTGRHSKTESTEIKSAAH